MESGKELSAKEMFKKYDCSSFCMARENLDLYEYYQSLHISKEQETIWRKEQLEEYSLQLMECKSKTKTKEIVYRMYGLVENLKDKESVSFIKSSIEAVLDELDEKTKLYIAHTIIGKAVIRARDGLIFISYDIGEKQMAEDFLILALRLLDEASKNEELKERIIDEKNKCFKIKKKLKLRIC